jgi:hypothetical protein
MKHEITLVYDAGFPSRARRSASGARTRRTRTSMGRIRSRRAGHACATSPFRVADDSCRRRRCSRRGGHAAAASCRVSRGERGLSGVPSAEAIAEAIANRAALVNTPRMVFSRLPSSYDGCARHFPISGRSFQLCTASRLVIIHGQPRAHLRCELRMAEYPPLVNPFWH